MLLPLLFLLAAPGCDQISRYVYKIALHDGAGRRVGFGAGFFLDAAGTFVTARHIFEDVPAAARAQVEVRDVWRDCPVESVLASSRDLDVVILRVRLDSAPVQVPRPAAALRIGDLLRSFRLGPPLIPQARPETGIACTTGKVGNLEPREITVLGEFFLVSGSSGAPVFDASGRVAAVALEMVNWNPGSGTPDWTFTGLPIARVLELPRLASPVALGDFLAALRR